MTPVFGVKLQHRSLHTLDTTFGVYWGENRKSLLMPWFKLKPSKYLVSKFVLRYNIKPWGIFHPVSYWCMLLWIVFSYYVEIDELQSVPEILICLP